MFIGLKQRGIVTFIYLGFYHNRCIIIFMSKILSAFKFSQGKMQVVWLNNQRWYLKYIWFPQEF